MSTVQLIKLTKEIVIEDTRVSVQLSPERKNEIEAFWKEVNKDGRFFRGESFHVDSVKEEAGCYHFKLKRTDYAHYLHTIKSQITDKEGCKTIFGAGLVETTDGKYVFGEMANHTAFPSRLQCVGGGLSWEDKEGDYFQMKDNVLRELEEELGISPEKHVTACEPVYMKIGGVPNSILILYSVKINLSQEELKEVYHQFTEKLVQNGEKPEFQNVIYLEQNEAAIQDFFIKDNRPRHSYLEPFLKKMAGKQISRER